MSARNFIPRIKTANVGSFVSPTSGASSATGGASASPTGRGNGFGTATPTAEPATPAGSTGLSQPMNAAPASTSGGSQGMSTPLKSGVLPSVGTGSEHVLPKGGKMAAIQDAGGFIAALKGEGPKSGKEAIEKAWWQNDQDGPTWGEESSMAGGDAGSRQIPQNNNSAGSIHIASLHTKQAFIASGAMKAIPKIPGVGKAIGAAGKALGGLGKRISGAVPQGVKKLWTPAQEAMGVTSAGVDVANIGAGGARNLDRMGVRDFAAQQRTQR